jgi:hypothetical protein
MLNTTAAYSEKSKVTAINEEGGNLLMDAGSHNSGKFLDISKSESAFKKSEQSKIPKNSYYRGRAL